MGTHEARLRIMSATECGVVSHRRRRDHLGGLGAPCGSWAVARRHHQVRLGRVVRECHQVGPWTLVEVRI